MKSLPSWHPISINMIFSILKELSAECPWRDTLHWYNETGSTNTDAKKLAENGAPHGTVVLAGHQTAGRGRMGRQFLSPAGTGIYMSVILRPEQKATGLMHLTCAAAVAMCDAVEAVCGFRPQVKWINDLVWQNKKLGGILTELSVKSDGTVNYAIVGIGINVLAAPEEMVHIADCLSSAAGQTIDPAKLAAAMIHAMSQLELSQKQAIMDRYRSNCLTLGKEVVILRADQKQYGKALSISDDGDLTVELTDGSLVSVSSGEVSVRDMYGYV